MLFRVATSQDLTNDLRSLLIRGQKLLALLALFLDTVILIQKIAEEFFLVQLRD